MDRFNQVAPRSIARYSNGSDGVIEQKNRLNQIAPGKKADVTGGRARGNTVEEPKKNLSSITSGLPTPPQEDLDDDMDRSSIGGGHSPHITGNGLRQAQTRREVSKYVQEDEIIFSSTSSSSDDNEEVGGATKPSVVRRQDSSSRRVNQPQAPYKPPSYQRGQKAGSFAFDQPKVGSLKRTADGRMRDLSHPSPEGQRLTGSSYKSSKLPASSKKEFNRIEDDDSDPDELLKEFMGKEDRRKQAENRVLPHGADYEIPYAVREMEQPGRKANSHAQSSMNTHSGQTQAKSSSSHESSFQPHQSRRTTTKNSSLTHSEDSDPLSSSRILHTSLITSRRRFQPTKDLDDDSASEFSSRLLNSHKSSHDSGRPPSSRKLSGHQTGPSPVSIEPFQFSPRPQSLPARKQTSVARKSTGGHRSKPSTTIPKIVPAKSRSRPLHPQLPDTSTLNLLNSPITTLLHRQLGNRSRSRMAAKSIETNTHAALRTSHEWKGASGDIIVVDWSPNGLQYGAGASAAMDVRNPQYNKRCNLLAGDLGMNTLHELPEHYLGLRVTSRNSVDHPAPLYTTITDLKWDVSGFHMYSSSYDWTVKRWDMSDPADAQCVDTFWHDNPVEVMALSPVDDNGLLATGTNHSNMATEAPLSLFQVYEDIRAESTQHHSVTNLPCAGGFKGYVPTVMQWGTTQLTKHYLAAGFSGKQSDSQEEPAPAPQGLLCLWTLSDDRGAVQKHVMPSSSNVFDAVWHPIYPWLAAASPVSPVSAAKYAIGTRSLIRVYNPLSSIHKIVEYECPALDINTVSFSATNPNIISASCTDGATYFWDHRMPGDIMCKLGHGSPLYPTGPLETRELHDTGVRVALWGANDEYFYSGSSDGVLKQWDIKRAPDDAFVRNVETFGAEIMSGKFSPDFSNLLVGDASGGIYILSADPNASAEEDLAPGKIIFERATLSGDDALAAQTALIDASSRPAAAAAQELVRSGQISIDPVFGPGQGPKYDGPYAGYAHADGDPANVLVPEIRALQLDERQSRGFESLLDEESARRKRANQGLARARNGGLSGAGTVSGVGEKRVRPGDNGEEAKKDTASTGRKKKLGVQVVDMEGSDDDMAEGVKIKDEDAVMRDAPARPAPPGWIMVPDSPKRGRRVIDLTELSD